MHYSIGEVSKQTGIPVSTLRYYDNEGMFPHMNRGSGGTRTFSETEINTLEIVECLKDSGLSIKDITKFLKWCEEGDASLKKRRDLFHAQAQAVTEQIARLQKTLDVLSYKCWYYDTAVEAGTERVPKEIPEEELPQHIRACKKY